LTSLVYTITETMRYKGAIGQWSWVLHRLTGLGVVFFLILHVVDTSWAVTNPAQYEKAIAAYQTPLFTIGEFFLVASVVYHALNGMRIAIIDFRPAWWKYQQRAAQWVMIATVLLLIPVFIIMFSHVLRHYATSPEFLGLFEVIAEQIPFAIGIAIAGVVAILLSAVVGKIVGDKPSTAGQGSNIERFWWSFMRVSGLLIVPLVFGHLAMIHLIQGVFDITAQNFTVVGTTTLNESGTAVEFVASRWNYMVAGVAIWRFYDFALLGLTVAHGFNGLRYVLTDYTMSNPLLRRAAIYACAIGAAVLLTLGGIALLNTIPQSSIEVAIQAAAELPGGHSE
jgi:succinate dehydrogenase / fumarate reductase, cytochrome b subunit